MTETEMDETIVKELHETLSPLLLKYPELGTIFCLVDHTVTAIPNARHGVATWLGRGGPAKSASDVFSMLLLLVNSTRSVCEQAEKLIKQLHDMAFEVMDRLTQVINERTEAAGEPASAQAAGEPARERAAGEPTLRGVEEVEAQQETT